ncbi:IS4 family transposase [Patescibacteria group bacterium]|nr:IS4 family transposase [Patescibacteria group bacterium]MBU2259218.1 IS4 family transposase [Patescibacteria group bacterium]
MAHTITVLGQLLQLLPRTQFQALTRQYKGDRYVKHFSCWNQLTVLLFAQLAEKESLREIETTMRLQDSTFYHLGMKNVSRDNLAKANRNRSYHIFEQTFYTLLQQCKLFSPKVKDLEIPHELYALDATVVSVCFKLMPWAKYRKKKGAFKIHTLYNVGEELPTFLVVTHGKVADVKAAQKYEGLSEIPEDSILTMDRAYNDYTLFRYITDNKCFFVVRKKKDAQIVCLENMKVSDEDAKEGVLKDERVGFVLEKAMKVYPEDLRLVTYHDKDQEKTYEFLTNNFDLSPKTIADCYKHRWAIEVFFKWIKQNLVIKTFLGTSENAVQIQVWVAMISYLLVWWVKHQTKFEGSMTQLTWMLKDILLTDMSLLNILNLDEKTLRDTAKSQKSAQMELI